MDRMVVAENQCKKSALMVEEVGIKITISGIVQGVGFRPFVYSQAIAHGLTGWVRNTSGGVEIVVNGPATEVERFIDALKIAPPPLARIDTLQIFSIQPDHYDRFEIQESQVLSGEFLPVSPDTAVCADCRRELFDPNDRRFRYPFINCTNCGPRFTIIRGIPYDRPNTTMAGFDLCEECARDYHNPLDRRFHAQPVACPKCGPQVWFEAGGQHIAVKDGAIRIAREWLRRGKILAIKGLGGFHLACDATNPQAVSELRRRKKRSDKPFALMAFDLEALRRHCIVTPEAEQLLLSRQAPIVLLERQPQSPVVQDVAPHQSTLGFMLAYTPLHLLLLEPAQGYPDALVMTSANMSEEPIAYQDEDARQRLSRLADGFLMHNRPIFMRMDDSVVRAFQDRLYPIRRARGYAPDPLRLPFELPQILAAGAELKNTFCLTRGSYAFMSHHIGDLENFETLTSFEEGIRHYERLFNVRPQLLACDLHPNYLASRYAIHRAGVDNLALVQIQHHHAHMAACMAENGLDGSQPVIGVCLDGTGYGTDGAIWGGEFLLGNYESYLRLYHLKYVPQPGGDLAARDAARMALAHLWSAGIDWDAKLPPVEAICADDRNLLLQQLERGLNTPLTSSMGRLFDAAAALTGVCSRSTYEGQAAIEFEAAADPDETGSYSFEFSKGLIDPQPMWQELLQDWYSGLSPARISARFHNGIVRLVVDVCEQIRRQHPVINVALSGGVWQNIYLLNKTCAALSSAGFKPLTHRMVPANDGGIALGQALVAAAIARTRESITSEVLHVSGNSG